MPAIPKRTRHPPAGGAVPAVAAAAAAAYLAEPAANPAAGIHRLYLQLLLDLLERQGLSGVTLGAARGPLAQAAAGDAAMIDVDTLRQLIPELVHASGRPWLGLELGAAVPVFGHGPLALAAAASGSLHQALELVARFVALRAPVLRFDLRQTASGVRLGLHETQPLGAARRFVFEAVLVMLERLLQALSGRSLAGARCELPWPEPAWAQHYSAFLAARVRFDARSAALVLPQTLLDSPCLGADPEALAFARAECQRRLTQGAPGRELLAGLRRRLLACEGGYPSAAEMAQSLGLSLRSFHRQLAAERSSYRGLLEEVRRERAQRLLCDTALPIERIAERLGYRDASNFSRCVRRWFGMSASERRSAERARRLPH